MIVIGAGSAGLAAARFAAQVGARVALVEQDRVGGDCTWTGCVPSKTLLHEAHVANQVRRAEAIGLPPAEAQAELRQVLARVRDAVERVYAQETPDALAEEGIAVIFGTARFVNASTIDVGSRSIHGRRFIICSGAAPAIPPIPGLDTVPFRTYEDIYDIAALPERLLVLGAGPVGVELGQAFLRLGSDVTIINKADRVLSVADPEASAALGAQLAEEGAHLALGVKVARVEASGDRIVLTANGETYGGGTLLVATGRQPRVDGLGLENASVAHSAKGIRVDGRLQTTQRAIYAAGDVTGSWQFTHYAGWQGFVAARNALLPGSTRGLPRPPWGVFTDPEVAQVGLMEQEARGRGMRVRVERLPMERIDRAQAEAQHRGFLKLVTRRDGSLVGATVVGGPATELANELALAVRRRLRLQDLAQTIHVYPTYGFAIQQASADAAIRDLTAGWRGALLRILTRWWVR